MKAGKIGTKLVGKGREMQDIHSECHPVKAGRKRSRRNMVRDTNRQVTVVTPTCERATDESL